MPLGSIGDVFQVVLKQTYLGVPLMNVSFYQQLNSNSDPNYNSSRILMGAFQEDVLSEQDTIQVQGVAYDAIEVINLFNVDDLWSDNSLSPSQGGIVAADVCSPWIALEYEGARITRNIRRARKFYAGIDETWLTQGQLAPAQQATVDAFAVILSSSIAYSATPAGPTFKPVNVKRIREVDEEGNVTYRLPEGNLEAVVYDITYSFKRVSTMNSRKSY